jgi:hypothetical protein
MQCAAWDASHPNNHAWLQVFAPIQTMQDVGGDISVEVLGYAGVKAMVVTHLIRILYVSFIQTAVSADSAPSTIKAPHHMSMCRKAIVSLSCQFI